MRECDSIQQLLDGFVYRELDAPTYRLVEQHLAACEECRGVVGTIRAIAARGEEIEPSDFDLAANRRRIADRIGTEEKRHRRFGVSRYLWAAAAIAAFVIGLTIRFPGERGNRHQLAGADQLANAIQLSATGVRDLRAIEESPYAYTNVRVTPQNGGKLAMSFDVTRHMEMTLPREHPLVTEVLVQSMLSPSSVGTKLEAISFAPSAIDSRVRGALIKSMNNDGELAVRLQAQARLAEQKSDPEIVTAMLELLEREASVQMRLLAIDYLAASRVEPQRVQRAVGAGPEEGRDAVAVRAAERIKSF
jgi:hypothetical protein